MDVETITQGTLRTQDGQTLPLLETKVTARIDGPLANVVVTQTFRNTRTVPIEAIYSFPLPHDASVWRMEFRIADRVVKGVIKERAAARRAYQAAKAEGRAVTLLEEDSPTVFTLSVANVAEGAEIVVHLEYQELVRYDDGRFVFVFPMVAPDLYRDGPAPAVGDAMPPPRMLSPERKADVALEIHIAPSTVPGSVFVHPVTEVHGRSHTVHPEVEPNGTTIVRLGGPSGGPISNRDFVLEWQASREGVQPVLRLEPPATDRDRGTFLLTLAPARADAKTEIANTPNEARPLRCGNCGAGIEDTRAIVEIAGFGALVKCKHCGAMLAPATSPVIRATRSRDVAIVFDRSASMRAAMPQAREMVMAVVDALLPGDTVMAMTFDHDRALFDGEPRWLATGPEVGRRIASFLDVPARGGSDVGKALEEIAKLPVREGRTRAIVLVTDGAVGNTGKLLKRVPEILGPATRLHVLGVGAAVNRHFLESLAREGRGACTIVAPRDNPRLVRDRFARKVIDGGPVLGDITLSWEGASPVSLHPSPLPELYGNEPLHIVGRYSGSGPSKLVITATTPTGTPFRQEIDVVRPEPAPPSADQPRLARIWARREVTKLIGWGGRQAEALALALEHSLATPLTSLIAEDTQISVRKVQIRKARLRVTRGKEIGQSFTIDAGVTRIGRAVQAEIRLADDNVSRMHLELIADAKGYRVRDLSSTNGTRVDGVQVRESALGPDSILEVGGRVEMVFEHVLDETLELLPTETVHVAEELEDGPGSDRPRAVSLDSAFERPPPRAAAAAPMPAGRSSPGVRPLGMPASVMSSPHVVSRPAAGMPMPPAVSLKASPHPAGAPLPRAYGTNAPPPIAPPSDEVRASSMDDSSPPPMMRMRSIVADTPPPGSMRAATPAAGAPHHEEVRAARRTTQARSMDGSLEEVPLVDLLQLFATARKTGVLSVSSTLGDRGEIDLRAGSIVAAEIIGRGVGPLEAVLTMARWTGSFDLGPPRERPFGVREPLRIDEVIAMIHADEHRHAGPGHHAPAAIPQAPALLKDGPAYPEAELTFVKHRVKGELDLALLVDATSSMGPYIHDVKARMNELLTAVAASPLCKSLRVAVVSYRDHPPQDATYASRVDLQFTSTMEEANRAVSTLTAMGGGDGPEAVTDGLHDVVRLDWRPDAAKAIVWFGDAPPHGVAERGDGFPRGCPCGNDWFAQAEACREMGIAIYAMGCLPGLRQYETAEHVYRAVARATNGMYLALHEAQLLVPLIAGAAESTLDDQRIDAHVLDLVDAYPRELAETDERERERWLLQGLHRKQIERRSLGDDGRRSFRGVVLADVDASLSRLRAQARISW